MRAVPRDLRARFKGASRVFKRSSKCVSREFKRLFKDFSRVFKECLKCAFRKIEKKIKQAAAELGQSQLKLDLELSLT